jgi:hypothetical protein
MVRLTVRYRDRLSPEAVDRLLGGLVVAFAALGIAAFLLFLLAALLTGTVRLITWAGGCS